MMAAPSALGKTPVSILQELLSRRGSTPKYELVQIEGAIHEPTFRYRVTVADIVAMGTGRSKKEAKHAAAKAILDKLIIGSTGEEPATDGLTNNTLPELEQIESTLSALHFARTDASSPLEDKIEGNPIGTLQELCMSRRWPPPNYEMLIEEGLPHERLFTIGCTVFKYKETGVGKSKKLAKRQAAHKMWEKLKDFPAVGQAVDIEENDEMAPTVVPRVPSMSARYADLKSSKISILSNPHSHKVSLFHKNLKHSTGAKLGQLQTTSMSDKEFDAVTFLHDISTEQQFEVTYVDIEERSLKGKMQCLVQLSTLPVAVCYGYGDSSKLAQASAARNALEYLKIMTKT